MLIRQRLAIPVFILAALLSQMVQGEPISGSFLAVRSCDSFVSKNKLTNPDRSRIDRIGDF